MIIDMTKQIARESNIDITNDARGSASRWGFERSGVTSQKAETINNIRDFMLKRKLGDQSHDYSGSYDKILDGVKNVLKEKRIDASSRDAKMLSEILPSQLNRNMSLSDNKKIVDDIVRNITDKAKGLGKPGFFEKRGQDGRLKEIANSAVFEILRENGIHPKHFTGFEGNITPLLTMMKQARSLANS